MDRESWLGLGLIALFLALLGLVTVADVGLGGVMAKGHGLRRGRFRQMADQGVPGAKAAANLLQNPQLLFSSLGTLRIIGLSGTVFLLTTMVMKWLLSPWGVMAAALAFAALVGLQLWVGALAARSPERAALMAAPWVVAATWPFRPLARLVRPSVIEDIEEGWELIAEDHQAGPLQEEERQMVRGILELEQTTAREIMVPRIDIVAVDTQATLSQVVDTIVERGYSRIPLYQDTIDSIVGVIYAKDIIQELGKGHTDARLEDIARPPLFIPESKKIHELLREFQKQRVHMAIVVDEYGGTEGLVTIEDLLEEIVGEIEDEYDREEPRIQRVSATEAIVDARLDIDSFNEEFGVDIEEEYFDTIGGFVYNKLGKMPSVGDEIHADGLTISVLSTLGRRIRKVRVAVAAPQDKSLPITPE